MYFTGNKVNQASDKCHIMWLSARLPMLCSHVIRQISAL